LQSAIYPPRWQNEAPLLTERRLFSMVTVNKTLLAFGGFSAAEGESQAAVEDSVEFYFWI